MSEPRPVAPEGGRGKLGTVRNAALLLDLLSDGPAYQQLTDLAERSGLAVPTAHRLLRSLVLADLVEQDPRSSRYSLGPEVARLSHRYLARLPILGALSPYLLSLRDTLQTSVQVALLVRDSVVYVDRVDALNSGPFRESHRVAAALHTPAGRLLAAHADDELWSRCVQGAPAEVGDAPETARKQWQESTHLASDPDDPLAEVAVAVTDPRGSALAALTATLAPTADPHRVAQHLVRAAAVAGRTLGHA